MNIKKKLLVTSAAAISALSVLGIVIRTLALFLCYDTDIGYFKADAALPIVFYVICFASLVFAVLFSAILPSVKKTSYPTPEFSYTYVKVGAVFAIFGICTFLFYLMLGTLGDTQIYKASNTTGMMEMLALIVGIVAVFYFALIAAGKTEKGNFYVYFAYAMIIFLLLSVSFTYFDYYTVMNGPNKIFLQLTMLLIMLFIISEQRFSIEKPTPRAYFFFTLASFYFSATCSLPYLIAFFCGKVTNVAFLFYHFMMLGYGAYIGARGCSFISSQKQEKHS